MIITIIGCGASGLLTLVNLLKIGKTPFVVNVIEPNSFGLGVAYQTGNMQHLLNVPAYKMSCMPEDSLHFVNWLKENNNLYKETDFVPRKIYGEYLMSTYAGYYKGNKLADVNHIEECAVDIFTRNDSYFVKTQSGKEIESDKIVLAIGNFPPSHPKTASMDYLNNPRYIANPLEVNSIERIKNNPKHVFIIGTGLTAVDEIISIRQKYPKTRITAFSNHGYLPVQHNLNQSYPSFYEELKGLKTILEVFKVVYKHIKLASLNHIDYKAVTDAIRPYTQEIWSNLPNDEKLRFLRHLRHLWGVSRHRMPSGSANYIYELINFGKVRLHKGRIIDIKVNKEKFIVVTEGEKKQSENIECDYVINCTGPQTDYRNIDNELVKNVINNGLVAADQIKYGISAKRNGAIISRDGGNSNKLYTIGPPMKGVLWECVAIPEIKIQASELATELLR